MEMSALPLGSQLQGGKYRINKVLGQGGFGITYEAEQVSLGRKVAVKEFFMKDLCNRDESTSHVSVPSVGSKELVERFRQKFIREARTIAGLDHNHIVRIYDVFEENGTAYYVMEYLFGGSLDKKIREGGALPDEEALDYVRQIADALHYLHSRNILHFDVKPSNVLLNENGIAKLIDFGISKHYDESGSQTSSTPVGISKGFAPLEQYQQGGDIRSFTPATDIYALGATLFALVAGNNPPEASVVGEDGLPAKPSNVSVNLWNAVEHAMSFRRKDRPQSVQEFLCLLDGTVKDEDDNEETVVPGTETKSKITESGKLKKPAESEIQERLSEQKESKEPKPVPASRRFPKWLFGVLGGLAVIAAAVYFIGGRSKQSAATISQPVQATSQPEQLSKPSSDKPSSPVVTLESISLSKTSLSLEEGATSTLSVKYTPANATDKSTTWESTDPKVAKVSVNGKVTALMAGSAAIIATSGDKTAYCNVTVKAKPTAQPVAQPTQSQSSATTGRENGHEWVDLGLSVKWATCNVGASIPSDYGSYFAWGETSPKNDYSWSTLKYCNDTNGNSFSKYVSESKYGPVDNKTTLELVDDAARANWGGRWRMPTFNEIMELKEKCTWTWTTQGGHDGYKVTSKNNGNSIFLPAAGSSVPPLFDIPRGFYWSSSLYTSDGCGAYGLKIGGGVDWSLALRYYGSSVRPVCR